MKKESLDLVVAGYIVNQEKLLLIHHKKLNKWLPVGGHIEKDETPDEALKREVKEEVGLDIDILGYPKERRGNDKQWALPFYVNVHHIDKTHFHYCLFYLCRPKTENITVLESELKGYKWLAREDLSLLNPPLNDGDITTCLEAIDLAKKY